MPRTPPLKPISIPQVAREQRLSQLHDFADLLGFKTFPDGVADELARVFAVMRETTSAVVGLTRKRQAAELKRYAKKLRREQQTGRRNIKIRQQLADAHLHLTIFKSAPEVGAPCGLDIETLVRLGPLTAAPTAELLAAVEACQRRLEQLPRINPQRQARESAGGAALWAFLVYATDSKREEQGAWWRFVLDALDATGFPTAKLYEHPEDLRPLLNELCAVVRPQADQMRDWLASRGTAEALLTLADKTEALLQDIAGRGALRTDT
jgi:hypothetical protein